MESSLYCQVTWKYKAYLFELISYFMHEVGAGWWICTSMYLWIINFWPFPFWKKKLKKKGKSWPSYIRASVCVVSLTQALSALPQLKWCQLLYDTLGFSPANNPSFLPMTGRLLPHRSNVGQLIIYRSTLLFRTWQLLSAQDSCTLSVWSKMSVSANATRLTSLMMSPHFEETTQSLIKNSDAFSLTCWFLLSFHQGLKVSFQIFHAKIKKKIFF